MSKLHGPVFGTAHTVAELMADARSRVDASVANATKDQRIRDLEREVERLKAESAGWERIESVVQRTLTASKADRADAARFRCIAEQAGDEADAFRAAIDADIADRAKEGEAVSAKNAHTDAAMAKDPQLSD